MLPDLGSPSRSLWQLLYGGVLKLRRRRLTRRADRLPRTVVSVGNLVWGGAGKTPLVAALAAHLRDGGRRVCVLSRGYGRRDAEVRVVSQGDGPLLGPAVAGDEPVLLAGSLPGVSVVVGPDRAAAGRQALERVTPEPDLFLLDDGFSHLRLARDLDLLAFPAADPWGGDRLPPSGRLREPLAAARYADTALLTDSPGPAAVARLADGLGERGFRGPVFGSGTEVRAARSVDGRELPHSVAVFLVSGIARPERFEEMARRQGFQVRGALRFRDHHEYTPEVLREIADTFKASGADVLLTTSKDRVKLFGHLDVPLAELPIRARPEEAFWSWLDERLREIESR
ncbi:MAG: tetraacyldisaccharide 4'-kinase [Thermoanaerobaculia bacterium]